MRKLFLLLGLTIAAHAQYTPVPSTGYPALEAILNGKLALQTSAGSCASLAGTAGKDICFDTTNLVLYDATVTGAPATWVLRSNFTNAKVFAALATSGTLTAPLATGSSADYGVISTALATSGIATVVLPNNGTAYWLNASINIPAGKTLACQAGAVIQKHGNFDMAALTNSNIAVTNCIFDANQGGGFTGSAVTATSLSNLKLTGNTFEGSANWAVYLSSVAGGVIEGNTCPSSNKFDCIFGEHNTTGILVSKNVIDTTGITAGLQHGIAFHSTTGGNTVANITITNNQITNGYSLPIEVGGFGGNQPTGIIVANNTASQVGTPAAYGGYSFSGVTASSITGNFYYSNSLCTNPGLELTSGFQNIAANNTVYCGATVTAQTNSEFTANTVFGQLTTGSSIAANANHNLFAHNWISPTGTSSPANTQAIHQQCNFSSADCGNNTYSENTLVGGGSTSSGFYNELDTGTSLNVLFQGNNISGFTGGCITLNAVSGTYTTSVLDNIEGCSGSDVINGNVYRPIATLLQASNNLSDLPSAPTARTNLGLGAAALQANSFFLQASNNLSDLGNAATARTNIGFAAGMAAGNAGTASALAALPTPCTTGQAPTGILANGNSTGCAALGAGIVTMVTQAGAPTSACTAPGTANLALSWDTTNHYLYFCTAVTPTWRQFLDNGTGSGFTSAMALSGISSGAAGFTVDDAAGTAILYILPSTNGAAGQTLQDNGSATCPTLAAGLPSTCHQLIWTTLTATMPQKFFGTAAPGSIAGNLPGDFFSDSTNHNEYWCNATSGTPAPACTSVTAGGWTLTNSGGSMVYPGAGIANSTGSAWGTSYGSSGTGSVCLTTSCTMTTPALGTPSAIVLTSATGLPTAGLVNNAVTSPKLAVVNTYRVCDLAFGDTSSSSVIANAQLGPQVGGCFIPGASTVVEMDVRADGGTPNIIIGGELSGTVSNLVSGALATAASGARACSKTTAVAGIDGTTCSATLQNTSLAAGTYIQAVSGTAGGTAKWMTVHVIYTVN